MNDELLGMIHPVYKQLGAMKDAGVPVRPGVLKQLMHLWGIAKDANHNLGIDETLAG